MSNTVIPAAGSTIHAVAMQSVDPEEASVGGVQWNADVTQLDAFIESERSSRAAVDFEYLRHTLTVPDGLSMGEEVTDWGDDVVWTRTPERRVVILGDRYPGAERRRIDREMER